MGWSISRFAIATAVAVMVPMAGMGSASSAPLIVGKYYEENGSVGCGVSNGCSLFFTAVPAGKSLLVTGVSCLITEANNRIVSVRLGAKNGNSVKRRQYLESTLTSGTTGLNRHNVNQATSLLFGPNVQPGIELVTDLSEASSFECQIRGVLNPPLN